MGVVRFGDTVDFGSMLGLFGYVVHEIRVGSDHSLALVQDLIRIKGLG